MPVIYRVAALLLLGAIGLLTGVMALVALAATGLAVERAIVAYHAQQLCGELEAEAGRLRPLARICEIQTETSQLLLTARGNDTSQPQMKEDAGEGEIPKLPSIDDLDDELGDLL